MAKVHIASAGAPLSTGLLQLENGVAMDATLRAVADQNNTTSPLELSTGLVSVTSTLQIATNDVQYIDAEDTGGNNRFTVSRAVGSQTVNVDFASNPTLGTDQVGAIRTYQDGVSLSDSLSFQKNGQATFSERVKVEADSTATTQSVAVIQSSTTDAGLVLQPNGTGAIMAQVPDGTAAGGDARGQYAVDLQMVRGTPGRVASSQYSILLGGSGNYSRNTYSIVVGGSGNDASGTYSFIGGGVGNTTSGGYSVITGGSNNSATTTNATVVGGDNNNATDRDTFIGGGAINNASSRYSTISGGQSNTASTNAHATVVGGYGNTSSGSNSVSGGNQNVSSGAYSVSFGYSNSATGQSTVTIGQGNAATNSFATAIGVNNVARAPQSIALGANSETQSNASSSATIGSRTNAYLYGQFAHAADRFSALGDAQQSTLVARKSDTLASAATTVLSLDGTGTTNLIIPDGNNRAWNVTVKWVAVVTAANGAAGIIDGDSIASTEQLLFKRVAGTSSVVGSASTLSTHSDASMVGCSMAYTAGASQELALTFTGPTFAAGGPVDCRIVAKVELTEVAW